MSKTHRRLLLDALLAELTDGVWRTRCLHCRAALHVTEAGVTLDGATLEHVVPQSWFDRRAAADFTRDLSGPNDPRNLALACPRCNQNKGHTHDRNGPSSQRAREVVENLRTTRMARYRAPGGSGTKPASAIDPESDS